MDNFNLNELYKSQPAGNPSMEELNKKMKQLKRSGIRKLYLTVITLSLTSIFIIWVWVEYNPKMYSTNLGIILILLAMAIYGFSYNQLLPMLRSADEGSSSSEFLQNLIQIKRKQQQLLGTLLNLYFIMLTIGICLYMIEPTTRMSMDGQILAYSVTLAWIALNWFYIRPRMIKKQREKIDALIERFSRMKEQIGEE
jgi:hypothetical protein